jgi:hypothetical protein
VDGNGIGEWMDTRLSKEKSFGDGVWFYVHSCCSTIETIIGALRHHLFLFYFWC